MIDFGSMTDDRVRELDERFPHGWSVAYTRADADKLYAGRITAVRPTGEVWSDDDDTDPEDDPDACIREEIFYSAFLDDGEPEDGEEFTGEPLDEGDGPRPGELAKPWETTVHD